MKKLNNCIGLYAHSCRDTDGISTEAIEIGNGQAGVFKCQVYESISDKNLSLFGNIYLVHCVWYELKNQ